MRPDPKILGGAVAVAVSLATPIVVMWEGKVNRPYVDLADKLTVCYGHTGGIENRRYSDAECDAILRDDLMKHALPIYTCVPGLIQRPNVGAASISLSYNIGTNAFCRSTIAKRFNAGQWKAGCEGFPAWRFVKGREVRGLLNRRNAEMALCLKGIR